MRKFIFSFIAWFTLFFILLSYEPSSKAHDLQYHFTELLAIITEKILLLFEVEVIRDNISLHFPNSILDITKGCNALLLISMFIAAVLSFPSTSWRKKTIWIILSFFILQALNILRLLFLSYIIEHYFTYFDFFHYIISQGALIASALTLFYLFLQDTKINTCK